MTVVVEKDGYVTTDSSLTFGGGRSSVTPGKVWEFDADHWHEYKERYSGNDLDVIGHGGEVVATFNSGYWNRVYFKESLADSGGN